jgi:hypothetical protein
VNVSVLAHFSCSFFTGGRERRPLAVSRSNRGIFAGKPDQGLPLKISNPEIDGAEFFSALVPSLSECDENREMSFTAIEFEGKG